MPDDPFYTMLSGANFWGMGAQLGGNKKVKAAKLACVTTEMPADPDLDFVNGPGLESDRYFLNLGSNASWDGSTLTSGDGSTWSVELKDKRKKRSVIEVTFDRRSGPLENLMFVGLGDSFTGNVYPDPYTLGFTPNLLGFPSGETGNWSNRP